MLKAAPEGGVENGGRERAPSVVSGMRICQAAGIGLDGSAALGPPSFDRLSSAPVFAGSGGEADAEAAARALQEEGWAVLRGALRPDEVEALAVAAWEAADELLKLDDARLGNRGPRRYSFGGASRTHHMVHLAAWARLLDNAAVRPVLERAFGGSYVSIGGGGDFVLGETDTHQRLHVDLQLEEMYDVASPPAAIAANFAVSDVGCDDGPMRLVPRTQRLPLALAEDVLRGDERWSRASHLEKEAEIFHRLGLRPVLACPLSPGDVLLRDMRVWHAGSPNRGSAPRLLPSAEFLSPWYANLADGTDDHFAPRPALPFAHWWAMSPSAREAARRILAAPQLVRSGVREDYLLMLPYVAEDRP